MTKNTEDDDRYLSEQLGIAHAEFKDMLLKWAERDAHPITVAVVFCTGLFCNLKEFLEPEHYDHVVDRILKGADELTEKEKAMEKLNAGKRNLH